MDCVKPTPESCVAVYSRLPSAGIEFRQFGLPAADALRHRALVEAQALDHAVLGCCVTRQRQQVGMRVLDVYAAMHPS